MDLANTLESLVQKTEEDFNAITDAEWTAKPNPRKWSRKEILGHLVDSAVNNLKRFCEVQFMDARPYVVQKYRQEELVKANRYQESQIKHLVLLWGSVNRQIAYILKSLPDEILIIEILTSEGETQSVGWLAEDYVVHLRHHLAQIFDGR